MNYRFFNIKIAKTFFGKHLFNVVVGWIMCRKWYSRPVFWNGKWGSEYWPEAFPPGGKGVRLPSPSSQI